MNNTRSLALDAFRGLTVALMILVNNPGSWTEIYWPFEHAKWHGLTPTDLVFPFFLFAVGNAQALVLPRLKESGQFFSKVIKRTLIVFFIGFFLNWFPGFVWVGPELIFKNWTWINVEGVMVGLRVMGVLQRIALAYGASAFLIYFFEKRILWLTGLLLLAYWGLCYLLGTGDIYSLNGWFGTPIDKAILGEVHLYQGEGIPFDPEGLMSTIPSIAHVLLGYWVGSLMVREGAKVFRKFAALGVFFLMTGVAWHFLFPINKKIWTSSYVLTTTGLALMLLAALIYFLDVLKKHGQWSALAQAFGKNPLFIYVLSLFLPKLLNLIRIAAGEKFLTPLQWFYENVCVGFPGDPKNGSFLYSLLLVAGYGLVAFLLDRKKIYVRV